MIHAGSVRIVRNNSLSLIQPACTHPTDNPHGKTKYAMKSTADTNAIWRAEWCQMA